MNPGLVRITGAAALKVTEEGVDTVTTGVVVTGEGDPEGNGWLPGLAFSTKYPTYLCLRMTAGSTRARVRPLPGKGI